MTSVRDVLVLAHHARRAPRSSVFPLYLTKSRLIQCPKILQNHSPYLFFSLPMARKLFIILPAIFIQQHLISTGVQDEHANTLGFLSRTTWWLIRRTEEGMASFCGAHVPDLRSLPSSSQSPRTRGRVARGCSSSMAPKRGAPAPPISLSLSAANRLHVG